MNRKRNIYKTQPFNGDTNNEFVVYLYKSRNVKTNVNVFYKLCIYINLT